MKFLRIVLLALLAFSCSKKNKADNEDLKLYQKAISEISKRNFQSAGDNLAEIENEYPYSKYAAKAEILNAFISYLVQDFQEAHDQADKFIKLRPANENITYMYFLRAISLLELVRDRYREADTAIKTQRDLRELLTRFPDSIYTKTAEAELASLENIVASHEIEIAKFYQFRQDYIAAIIRLRKLIEEFPNTKYIAEAHFRLRECYISLGLKEEAQNEKEILEKTFPDSKWFKYSDLIKVDLEKK